MPNVAQGLVPYRSPGAVAACTSGAYDVGQGFAPVRSAGLASTGSSVDRDVARGLVPRRPAVATGVKYSEDRCRADGPAHPWSRQGPGILCYGALWISLCCERSATRLGVGERTLGSEHET